MRKNHRVGDRNLRNQVKSVLLSAMFTITMSLSNMAGLYPAQVHAYNAIGGLHNYASNLYDNGDVLIDGDTTIIIDDDKTIRSIITSGSCTLTITGASDKTLTCSGIYLYDNGTYCCNLNVISGNLVNSGDFNIGTLNVSGGTINTTNNSGTGIYASSDITISGGSVTSTSDIIADPAIAAGGILTISGGTVEANGAISAHGNISISENNTIVKVNNGEVSTTNGKKTIDSPLIIATPSGGRIDDGKNRINTSDGYPATEVEIKAIQHTVTVTNDGHGTGTASPASATAGTPVSLTATPGSGYHFKEWQVVSGGVTVTNNQFTMPNTNVEVRAIFEADSPGPTPPGPTPPTPPVADKYSLTSGAGSWARGSEDYVLTINPDESFDHFTGLSIDNRELTPDTDYKKERGSLKLTIKSSVLSKLSNGNHRIEVRFNDGNPVAFDFTVKNASRTYDDDDSPAVQIQTETRKAPKTGEV